jgi:outer membrane murein-binding lipoprotein Lpp
MNSDEEGERPARFYSSPPEREPVKTNAVAVVLASVLLCGLVGAGVGPQLGATETTTQPATEDMGRDVSVFMQRGVAAANGSVDSGMWTAAFETAENQSRKEALVAKRTATLSVRLDRLATRIEAFRTQVNGSTSHRARRARLAADRDALSTAISETKTTATSEGVNASSLDRLGQRVENLSAVPTGSNGSAQTPRRTPGTTKTRTNDRTDR